MEESFKSKFNNLNVDASLGLAYYLASLHFKAQEAIWPRSTTVQRKLKLVLFIMFEQNMNLSISATTVLKSLSIFQL